MKKKDIIFFILGSVLLIFSFIPSVPFAVRIVCSALVYVYFGFEVFKDMIEEFSEGEIFNEGFLMCAATVGAVCIGEFADAAAVMFLFSLGEALSDLAFDRSMDSLEKLIDLTPEYAYLLKDGQKIKVDPRDIKIGDTVAVSSGERIPVDGTVLEGNASADYSSVTGEPEPFSLEKGGKVISGGTISGGSIVYRSDCEYSNSTAAKMKAAMDEAAEKKAPYEKFIGRFAKIYTPAAIAAAVLVAVIGIILGNPVYDSVKSGLVIMVISCPCALVLSVPLTYCAAMGCANRHGFFFKGGESVERAANVGAFAFDKTGTLTEGSPGISAIEPNGIDRSDLTDIAHAVMKNSAHPLSKVFCQSVKPNNYLSFANVREIPGKGLTADVGGKPAVAGNVRLLAENGIDADSAGDTAVYIGFDGKYIGRIVFEDKIKNGAGQFLADLKKTGVSDIVLMSGDGGASVEKTARELGIERYYSGLLPDEKLKKFEEFYEEEKARDPKRSVAFCGDGLNDSAVIKRSDAGFAMGGGDGGSGIAASIEAADIVIGNGEITKVLSAVRIAKKTVRKIKQNVTFALAVKAAIMLVSIFVFRNMELAVAADVGVTLICILNAMSIK